MSCTVTAADALESGGASTATLTVANSLPVVTSVHLAPEDPRTGDDIVATAVAVDADLLDEVTLAYEWTRDGDVLAVVGDTLPWTMTTRGDEIVVSVTPSDESVGIGMSSAPVVVGNTPPAAPELEVTPSSPLPGVDDLVCNVTTPSTDADGDLVDSVTTWTVDGVAVW